jgi:hypothetical protein
MEIMHEKMDYEKYVFSQISLNKITNNDQYDSMYKKEL